MRADRSDCGPVSGASHASHIRIHDLAPRSRVTAIERLNLQSSITRRLPSGRRISLATKGVDMSTSGAVADWIKRIADDERRRDTVRVREDEMAARKADLVRRNGRRLIDELRATVTRDVEAFRDEFAGDPARDIVVEVPA